MASALYIADLHVLILGAENLIACDTDGLADPYCNVRIVGDTEQPKQRTNPTYDTLNPVWNKSFNFGIRNKKCSVEFHVWNKNTFRGNDSMGHCDTQLDAIKANTRVKRWIDLKGVPHGKLLVELFLTPKPGWGDVKTNSTTTPSAAKYPEPKVLAPEPMGKYPAPNALPSAPPVQPQAPQAYPPPQQPNGSMQPQGMQPPPQQGYPPVAPQPYPGGAYPPPQHHPSAVPMPQQQAYPPPQPQMMQPNPYMTHPQPQQYQQPINSNQYPPTATQNYPTRNTGYPGNAAPGQHNIIVSASIPQVIPRTLPMGVTAFQMPTRFRLKHKWFSSNMKIEDAYGNPIFVFKNKVISLGTDMYITDCRNGQDIGQIKQQLRLGMPQYSIYVLGRHHTTLKQKFTLGNLKFEMDTHIGQKLVVTGNWYNCDFNFTRGGRLVARASKDFFSYSDSYGIEIMPGEDALVILASAVIIDKCVHSSNQNHNHHHNQVTVGTGLAFSRPGVTVIGLGGGGHHHHHHGHRSHSFNRGHHRHGHRGGHHHGRHF
mmetsp:Transcript_15612/g.17350  ORF Transcript_15612/g.17350 Transcript_15612/m.17350 type:complete len:540 (+) Transcript_15612:27-1646(+)